MGGFAAERRREQTRTHEPLLIATNQRIGAVEASVLDGFRATGQITEAINSGSKHWGLKTSN
jgi:hypothetical protein